MSDQETTQQVKRVPNPTGKGGFGDNPQNRNAGGRITNAESISYWYTFFLNIDVEDFKEWLLKNPEKERTMACELAYNAVVRARKDLKYLTEVTDRTEGKAKQKIQHEGDLTISMQMERNRTAVDRILENYEQGDNTDPATN